jgi:hypothetical protein
VNPSLSEVLCTTIVEVGRHNKSVLYCFREIVLSSRGVCPLNPLPPGMLRRWRWASGWCAPSTRATSSSSSSPTASPSATKVYSKQLALSDCAAAEFVCHLFKSVRAVPINTITYTMLLLCLRGVRGEHVLGAEQPASEADPRAAAHLVVGGCHGKVCAVWYNRVVSILLAEPILPSV